MITTIKLGNDGKQNFELLQKFALDSKMSSFGACGIDKIKNSFHPSLMENPSIEKLTNAISIAFHLSDSIIEGIFTQPTPHYAMHYNRVNSYLDEFALKITEIAQSSGFMAMPVPASQIIDKSSQRGYLNHKIVGSEAGTGFIGRNNLLVSPEFGSRMRLVTILTDMPLAAKSKIEYGCGSCRACVSSCPAGAIGESAETFNLARCVEQISKFQKLMFVARGICGICVKACRGGERK